MTIHIWICIQNLNWNEESLEGSRILVRQRFEVKCGVGKFASVDGLEENRGIPGRKKE